MPNFNHLQDSHRTRMQDCLSFKSMKQNPVALWRHFPVDDQDPDRFARAISNFQDTFDFDFIKVTPASSFCLKDWRVEDVWKGNPEGTREITLYPIKKPDDWMSLAILDPNKGALKAQCDCLHLLIGKYLNSTPIIQTIFNPLAQAKNLIGKQTLIDHLHQYPDQVKYGLDIITKSTILFLEKCHELKIDGIFYAIQHAQRALLTMDEFDEFCYPYDLKIMNALNEFWLNIIHIHGEDIYFDKVMHYPASVLNWHDTRTPPTLSEARSKYQGVICGGISQWESLAFGTPDQIRLEAEKAFEATQKVGFILGTGCVAPIISPFGNIIAVRESVI